MKRLKIQLPDLDTYRHEFELKYVQSPLPTVPFSSKGLLTELPFPSYGKTGWPWTVETEPSISLQVPPGRWPKISIVTPSYNQEQFIEETIRSVLLQNYPNLEYIIIDGGSSDKSIEIIKKYEQWLSLWISEQDRGQAHAINRALSIMTGTYWQWINSDDRYFPNVLFESASLLLNSKCDTLYGSVHESTDDGKISYNRTSFNIRKEVILNPKSVFNQDFYYKPEAAIISLELSKKVGGFREDFHNLFDTEFMLRYADICTPKYTDIKLVHYRIHDSSKTIATAQRMYEEYFTFLKEHHSIGSIKWFYYIFKKAGYLSTRNQSSKSRLDLMIHALKLLISSPYVLISRAYWGLWRKLLMGHKNYI